MASGSLRNCIVNSYVTMIKLVLAHSIITILPYMARKNMPCYEENMMFVYSQIAENANIYTYIYINISMISRWSWLRINWCIVRSWHHDRKEEIFDCSCELSTYFVLETCNNICVHVAFMYSTYRSVFLNHSMRISMYLNKQFLMLR